MSATIPTGALPVTSSTPTPVRRPGEAAAHARHERLTTVAWTLAAVLIGAAGAAGAAAAVVSSVTLPIHV